MSAKINAVKELTPLLHRPPPSSLSFKWIVHGLLLFAIAILVGYIAVIMVKQKPHSSHTHNSDTHLKIKQFTISPMTSNMALIGYNAISQLNEFNYSDVNDYMDAYRVFADYLSFNQYAESIGKNTNMMDQGFYHLINQIVTWILASSARNITSFDAEWQYIASTQTQETIVSVLESESTFNGKQFMQYLEQLLNANEWNETVLLYMIDTFANDQFDDIDVAQMLKEDIASFGGGIGFGIQIYCNDDDSDSLIFDAGAGGGGGYNVDDGTTALRYGGGGGTQINNVSMGGGTGYETNQYIIDPNANFESFYGDQLPYFDRLLKDKAYCERLSIVSGGGSGAGFTSTDNDTNLVSWSYYEMNVTVA